MRSKAQEHSFSLDFPLRLSRQLLRRRPGKTNTFKLRRKMASPPSPSLAALMDAAARAADAGDDARAEPLFQRLVAENPRDAAAWPMLPATPGASGRQSV